MAPNVKGMLSPQEDSLSPSSDVHKSGYNVVPEAGKLLVVHKKIEFVPHVNYFGWADSLLGISMFWMDKFFALILYLQRYAVILMWNVHWPQQYLRYSTFYYGFLLDFTSHPDGRPSLGAGTILEGCQSACRVIWPIICLPILLTWAGVSLFKGVPLYYTRNIERVLWSSSRLLMLPFCSMLIRYYILGLSGNLNDVNNTWTTPISELGVAMLAGVVFLFVYVGYVRSESQLLFYSTFRHESYLKTREMEYILRLSATYRNARLWMISSYVFDSWYWSIARVVVDVAMLIITNFLPPKVGVILGDIILFMYFAHGFLYDIYRCKSTSHMEHVFNCTLFIYCVLATIQAYGVTSTWLVDTQLDYFLLSIGAFTVFVALMMALYYFVDSHRFVGLTVAERRANEKWKRTYGGGGAGFKKLDKVELKTMKSDELESESMSTRSSINRQSFRRTSVDGMTSSTTLGMPESSDQEASLSSAKYLHGTDNSDSPTLRRRRRGPQELTVAERKRNEGQDMFLVPSSGGFLSLDSESVHLWPVHDGMINELLRMNQENHLVDMLRAARAMLDRISALHNTAMLIPLDELKTHIFRLQQCVDYCKRYRVIHHANLVHPLQAIFEELIEQFSYELRIFNGVSITVGHNAKKMIKVSRELHVKQSTRDVQLALVSPLMRRVLVKLLTLRLFILLMDKGHRRTLLGRSIVESDDSDVDEFGPRKFQLPEDMADGIDSDEDDDDDVRRPFLGIGASARGGEHQGSKTGTVQFRTEDPFADTEDVDPFADAAGDEATPRPREVTNAFGVGEDDMELNGGEFGEFSPADADEEDNAFASLLAAEARKLLRHDTVPPRES